MIDESLNFLNHDLEAPRNNLLVVMTAYAFALKNHPSTRRILVQLKSSAVIVDNNIYWNLERSTTKESSSVTVEIAAYAIMTFVTAKRSYEAVPITNWLRAHRTFKGFYSTIDTVVALQAMNLITK